MGVWYEQYTNERFRGVLKTYFNTRFAWRFEDPDHAFMVIADTLFRTKLPKAKLTHHKNPTAYVYSCFNNAARDYGDSLYKRVTVPEELASYGKRFCRLFWDFCLNQRSVQELMGYCELSEKEVRIWTRWLTRNKKCPNPGEYSVITNTGEPVDPDSAEATHAQESPFVAPESDYRAAQQRYFLNLWSEVRASDGAQDSSEIERTLRALPRPRLSVTEKLVLRCQLNNLSIDETAELLGMEGKEQQIKNALTNLKKRIIKFCQDNNIEY